MKKPGQKALARRRKTAGFKLFMLFFVLLALFIGWMNLTARCTRLCPAEVYLADLPRSFEGARILYISDLKLRSPADARAAKRLMKRLTQLEPDILLLGGDYSAGDIMSLLNGSTDASLPAHTADFIACLSDFPAPMGKFAVAGDNDSDLQTLAGAFSQAQVKCLADSSAAITVNGETIHIAGLSDPGLKRKGSAMLCQNFRAGDCVIAIAHNPTSYIEMRVSEAKGGGAWADMLLSGHTLGGQIKLFGRTLRSFTDEEKRTLSGWFYPNDLPLLVSEGLGCDAAQLRLGSNSQVHLITLHKQEIL